VRTRGERDGRLGLARATMGRPGKDSLVLDSLSPLHASFDQNYFIAPAEPGSGSVEGQLTNRLMRTFITNPNAKNTKAVADPP
jgi:hypothetical protein